MVRIRDGCKFHKSCNLLTGHFRDAGNGSLPVATTGSCRMAAVSNENPENDGEKTMLPGLADEVRQTINSNNPSLGNVSNVTRPLSHIFWKTVRKITRLFSRRSMNG
jgi:hypothetical protein